LMKKFIIDRFEGNYAVCEMEDKSFISIPKYKLPLDCREGDCLLQDADDMYQMDIEAKTTKEKKIRDKMNRLFE
ncbi:MAG: hypothetical protein K0R34_4401, partial [Herbinix sp.]|nr:hypothetical protein [Herbinix sp.]